MSRFDERVNSRKSTTVILVALAFLLIACDNSTTSTVQNDLSIRPKVITDSVANDADDPAIWVHPRNPAKSLILGTNKAAAPDGALVVFNMDGILIQQIDGIDLPNNVDVEYGIHVSGSLVDVAVLTERNQSRLRVFAIDPSTSRLREISSEDTRVFDGQPGRFGEPMGVSLYRNPEEGTLFAFVSRKMGPQEGYIRQYMLEDDGVGKVRAVIVREFGAFSGGGEIEAVAVDDESGIVYYADEDTAVHRYLADPSHPDADQSLPPIATSGFTGDREGIAIYESEDGGYVIVTDQIAGNSAFHFYSRTPDITKRFGVVYGGADETDGIEATSHTLGSDFPIGALVAMNSAERNFLVYDWRDVQQVIENRN